MIMNETDNTLQSETITEKAYLVADVGSCNTTVSLIDVVAGSYRLLATATVPTTIAEPWGDVSQGIQHALKQVMDITGRKLVNSRGDIIRPSRRDGSGIDFFTAVFSAAPLLHAMIVGLSDNVSLQSARRVLQTNYTNLVCQFSPSDNRSEEEQLQAFIEAKPDTILIAGGTDSGATNRLLEIINIVHLGMQLSESSRKPSILFAGNKELREQITNLFGSETTVHIADNLNPTLQTENLDSAISLLNELYKTQKIHTLPGMREVLEWSYYPFLPTAQAFTTMIEYMAALNQSDVLGVDIGSSTLTLVTAVNNKITTKIYTDMGMGQPAANILSRVSSAKLSRWLPVSISDEDVANYVHNKALHPHTIPMNEQSLYIEQAIAREFIRSAVAEMNESAALPPFRLLVARGATLGNTPKLGQAVLTLLDALEPVGIFSIVLDKHNILPALGTLALHNPLTAVQSLENGALVNIGWVIAPSGKIAAGQKAVTIVMESENSEILEVDVDYGDITLLPLPPGESAKITVKPVRRLDIGFGPGKSKSVKLAGGVLGIIIDTRGRPINLTRKNTSHDQLIQQWLRALGK